MMWGNHHLPKAYLRAQGSWTERTSGVEAADTKESDAQEEEGRARDGIVGVAQYVTLTLQGQPRVCQWSPL